MDIYLLLRSVGAQAVHLLCYTLLSLFLLVNFFIKLFPLTCAGYCAFIDAEHALDPALAEAIGVNTENLLLSQPDCGEQALSLVDTLIRSGSLDVVVVDSVRIQSSLIDAFVSSSSGSTFLDRYAHVCMYAYAFVLSASSIFFKK